jgi:hypothetical protein
MHPLDRLEAQLVAAMKTHLSGGQISVPIAGDLVWRWFGDLSSTRTWHNAGPNPIAHTEILAWMGAARWPLGPRHIRLIRALDDEWIAHFYAQRSRERAEVRTLPLPSEHAVSPLLFDAMFGG